MRTWERMRKMQDFFQRELCNDRQYKAPKPSGAITYGPHIDDFSMATPRTFLGWQPIRPDEPGKADSRDPFSVCPSITIMPANGYARYMAEHRFDRYQKIHRPQDMGQSFCVQILFSIYEPGTRYPGFADGLDTANPDMSLIKDGTEAGLEELVNWMDDAIELLLRERTIPDTDLVLEDDTFTYGPFSDQSYIVDRRPLYQGFLNVEFHGYANKGNDHGKPSRAARLLDGLD